MEVAGKMPKHSLHSVKVDKEKEIVDKEEKVEKVFAPKYSVNYRQVRLMIDANMRATGSVTGNSYSWNGAGSVVDVDERDVENLLNKRQGGRQCCGGTGYGNVIFELAEVT